MTHVYFVKFAHNRHPERFRFETVEQMWHDLREFMLRNNTGDLEWMIRE